jgi:methionine-rich copper-binding protein CopC
MRNLHGNRTLGRCLIPLLFIIMVTLLPIPTAEAHASLVRSEPPAGVSLATAPQAVVLEFSEDLDPSFSAVQLLNGSSQVVNPGPGMIDPTAPRVLRLALAVLPQDSYTAVWKARSAADGHITRGSVPFGVGVVVNTTALIPASDAPDPATLPPPWLEAAVRWLTLLLAAVALGGFRSASLSGVQPGVLTRMNAAKVRQKTRP